MLAILEIQRLLVTMQPLTAELKNFGQQCPIRYCTTPEGVKSSDNLGEKVVRAPLGNSKAHGRFYTHLSAPQGAEQGISRVKIYLHRGTGGYSTQTIPQIE